MAKTRIGAESVRAKTSNIIEFPRVAPKWKYPFPDMDNPVNRQAWENLIDFGLAFKSEG